MIEAKMEATPEDGDPDSIDGKTLSDQYLCGYYLINAFDPIKLNVTPAAINALKVVSESFTKKITDLDEVDGAKADNPTFEVFNNLGIPTKIRFASNLKVREEHMHNVQLVKSSQIERMDSIRRQNVTMSNMDHNALSKLAELVQKSSERRHTLYAGKPEYDTRSHFESKLSMNTMNIEVSGFEDINCSVRKNSCKLIDMKNGDEENHYAMLVDVQMKKGKKTVTIRSPLEIRNETTVPMIIYCSTEVPRSYLKPEQTQKFKGSHFELAIIPPKETYNVPLFIAYHCQLFMKPDQISFLMAEEGIWWQDIAMSKLKRKIVECEPWQPGRNPFQFKFMFHVELADGREVTGRGNMLPKDIPHHTLVLHPPAMLLNTLPYNLLYSVDDSSKSLLKPGEKTPLYTADMSKYPTLLLKLKNYMGNEWLGLVEITSSLDEFKAIKMQCVGPVDEFTDTNLTVSIHTQPGPCMQLKVYSPYWIVNRSGLPIQLKAHHSTTIYGNNLTSEPVLFRFKKHRSKKVKMRVYNSKWTKSFSLDTVESSGLVVCDSTERQRKFQFLLSISLSSSKLTKIVMIFPYFLILNKTPHELMYMEENVDADLWMTLKADESRQYWPMTTSMKMKVRFSDSQISSQHFHIDDPNTAVLRMDRGTALKVEVTAGVDVPNLISFMPYEVGDAPVRVINLCDDAFLKLHQKNQSQVTLLSPNQSVLYTWDDPTAERTLMWNLYNSGKPSHPAFIHKDDHGQVMVTIESIKKSKMANTKSFDGAQEVIDSSDADISIKKTALINDSDLDIGKSSETFFNLTNASNNATSFKPREDKLIIHWVSYLDGLQRVFLLTQSLAKAKNVKKFRDSERGTLGLFVSLSKLQVSIVNVKQEELALLSLESEPAVWQVEVRNRDKTIDPELTAWLEEKWRQNTKIVDFEGVLEANFETMEMTLPFPGQLKRHSNPAFWMYFRQSDHMTYIQASIHRMQLDNQLNDAYFENVFFPGPVSLFGAPYKRKPLIEFAMLRLNIPEANIDHIKYFKLILQEFHVCVDKGFALSCYDTLSPYMDVDEDLKEQLQLEVAKLEEPLIQLIDVAEENQEHKIMFEYFHIAPIKIKVTFSLEGTAHQVNLTHTDNDSILFILKSIGVNFIESSDVEIKMALFELHNQNMTPSKLQTLMIKYYKNQLIWQLYVFLLGLDILGNPYGLFKDLYSGYSNLLHEPFLSDLDSPDVVSERMILAMKVLVQSSAGSLAHSAALITGSLGATMAALSFDSEYNTFRRQQFQSKPHDLPHSVLQASKTFVMSVALGVSGVVSQPRKGCQKNGLEGFFKGIGKGLMGVITKPAGGTLDMISMAMDGISRSVQVGNFAIVRRRLPRYIYLDQGLKPYSAYQAQGNRLLHLVQYRCPSPSDLINPEVYWAHAPLAYHSHAVILITTVRILHVVRPRIWSDWRAEYIIELDDLLAEPTATEDKLIIKSRSPSHGLEVREVIGVEDTITWLAKKIRHIMKLRKEGI